MLSHRFSLASCLPKDNNSQTLCVLPTMREITRPNVWTMLDHCCTLGFPFPAPFDSQITIKIEFPASLSLSGIPGVFEVSKPSSQGLLRIDRVKGDAPEKRKSTIDYKTLIASAESVAVAGDPVSSTGQ